MKRFDLLAAAVLSVGGIGLAASPAFAQAADQPAAQQPAAQPSGAAAQPAAAQPADQSTAAQPAGAQPGAAQQASESDVRQALAQTAQAVLTQGGASNLSQQFCKNDQDRLKDLSSNASQIDQSVQQLRQAYKDKFQKDLDLTASADQIFTSEFFRTGAAGDSARQASAHIGADQSSSAAAGGASGTAAGASAANPSAGVSGTAGQSGTASGQSGGAAASGQASSSGASGSATVGGASASGSVGSAGQSGTAASATGDQAQTASSSAGGMQSTTVTIPASHDMPEARINLVKEGSAWKIDLPESVDAQKLSQNLQQQLSQAAMNKDKWGSDANEAARAISHSVFIALGGDASAAASGASGTSGTSSGTSGGTSATPGTGTK
jgi:hypothetical protein